MNQRWQEQKLAETYGGFEVNPPGDLASCSLVEFVSRSNGRGRPARRSRGVSLLVYDRRAYQVVRGEIRSRKSGGAAPDVVACEVLNHLPWEERTTDRLLEEVKSRQRR